MPTLSVHADGGDRYTVRMGRHTIAVDQPVEAGGTDTGPTPTDLFVASLASCTAHYAGRFLRRHGLSSEGLAITCAFDMATDRPARVGTISLDVLVPAGIPEPLDGRFRAVIEHSTVKNSIATPPTIELRLHATDRTAA